MSLLIKALQKAEDDKKTDDKNKTSASALSLEPTTQTPAPAEPKALDLAPADQKASIQKSTGVIAESVSTNQKASQQQSASNLFESKTSQSKKGSKPVVLAGLALGVMLIGVGGFYYYLETLNPNQVTVNSQAAITPPSPPVVVASTEPNNPSQTVSENESSPETTSNADQLIPETEPAEALEEIAPAVAPKIEETQTVSRATRPNNRYTFGDEPQALTDSNSLKITRKQSENGVNPNLIAAYNAFNAGDDATAQQLYRNVLQLDTRNIDALLGMAAISSRQGRLNDANGWYAKVLEVEPRNTYAQAAMSDLASQSDPVSAESRMKNMIAQQPQAAHLHAALGQLYLDQGNWAAAQQAFFEAHHFAPNQADYAYNLAICLDQMGKGQLALPYYQKALLLAKSGPNSIDGNALETRIQALQTQK